MLGLYYSIFGIFFVLVILSKKNHYIIIKMLKPIKILNGSLVKLNFNLNLLFNFLSYRWYINYIYNELVALPTLKFSYNFIFLILDQGYFLYLLGQMYVSKLSTKYVSYD